MIDPRKRHYIITCWDEHGERLCMVDQTFEHHEEATDWAETHARQFPSDTVVIYESAVYYETELTVNQRNCE